MSDITDLEPLNYFKRGDHYKVLDRSSHPGHVIKVIDISSIDPRDTSVPEGTHRVHVRCLSCFEFWNFIDVPRCRDNIEVWEPAE